MDNKFIRADEVAQELSVSKPYAYKLIKKLNDELKQKGFITIAGRVNRQYFEAFAELYTNDVKNRLKENTWLTKEHIIRTKILPYFGKMKISGIGAKAAGVKRIRIHDLRHSHISLLIDMGFSAVAIADRVGHESIEITYRYAHLFPSNYDRQ